RRATITNAVTRGLSPNAELKDTGIKWLGKIPSHWEMSKIKYVSRYFSGGYPLPKNSAEPETEPWVQISDITKNTLDKPKARISKKDINEVNIQKTVKDSLLFSFKMSVGRTAISPIDLYTTSEIATFLPSDKIQSRYAFYAYPFYIPKNAKKNMAGSDLMNLELIGTARICLPPVPEQKEIVTFLDNENKTLEQLKQKIEKQVDILKERRISLISKAVTGKIKV
ncbi:restriction endonuclease subunit S, partial [Candidatus Saccharibacteria bacterium]|nr:restriction endonuclease subunit S [Candidatus Saccharibacteria bacterium]